METKSKYLKILVTIVLLQQMTTSLAMLNSESNRTHTNPHLSFKSNKADCERFSRPESRSSSQFQDCESNPDAFFVSGNDKSNTSFYSLPKNGTPLLNLSKPKIKDSEPLVEYVPPKKVIVKNSSKDSHFSQGYNTEPNKSFFRYSLNDSTRSRPKGYDTDSLMYSMNQRQYYSSLSEIKGNLNNSSFFKDDRLPLTKAAEKGYQEICVRLIETGANPNQADEIGSPLNIAAKNCDVLLMAVLIKRGAKPDDQTKQIAMNALEKNKKRLLWPEALTNNTDKTQEERIETIRRHALDVIEEKSPLLNHVPWR